ncbi:hypothetical protein NDU88_003206 [Pleurodeles waltl]|uniref:Uncharacterized protein n=1 Tax=Pleurodeles waltl TaxID=8319 RepID=A0AAV7MD78_PLEWA|nr:hypothetical protein NDU88_003206 [Pleurodeles waltl]
MVCTSADVTAADMTAIFYLFNHSIPDLRQERTYTASAAVTSVWKRQWLVRLGKGPLPSLQRSWRSSWTGSSPSTRYSTVLQTNRYVECTGHQASQCGTEPQHSQSPPVKHQKLDSARRERGKTPASKAAHKGPGGSVDSAVTPPKVGKGQKKSPKSGRSSTAEKTAIIPAAQEATASPIVTGQEATARVTAQEASPIVTGQEATARVTAQEASPIVTGQEATASPRVTGQEGPASHSPADP